MSNHYVPCSSKLCGDDHSSVMIMVMVLVGWLAGRVVSGTSDKWPNQDSSPFHLHTYLLGTYVGRYLPVELVLHPKVKKKKW